MPGSIISSNTTSGASAARAFIPSVGFIAEVVCSPTFCKAWLTISQTERSSSITRTLAIRSGARILNSLRWLFGSVPLPTDSAIDRFWQNRLTPLFVRGTVDGWSSQRNCEDAALQRFRKSFRMSYLSAAVVRRFQNRLFRPGTGVKYWLTGDRTDRSATANCGKPC